MNSRELLQSLYKSEPEETSSSGGLFALFRKKTGLGSNHAPRFARELLVPLLREIPEDAECEYHVATSRALTKRKPGTAVPLMAAKLELPDARRVRIGASFTARPDKAQGHDFYHYVSELIVELQEPLLVDQVGNRVRDLFESRVNRHLTRLIDVLRRTPEPTYFIGMPTLSNTLEDGRIRVVALLPEFRSYDATPPTLCLPDPRIGLHVLRALSRAVEDTRRNLSL